MPITEKRVHSIESSVGQIAQRVAKLEGYKEASAGPDKSSNAGLITLLSILGIAVIGYWAWIGMQVVAQGKQISQILVILSPEIIKNASSRPEDSQSSTQVEKVVTRAMKQGQRIDPNVIAEAGFKFVGAASTAPEAWKVAVALLNYKSFLNTADTSSPSLTPNNETFNTQYSFFYSDSDPSARGQARWLGTSRPPDVPEAHPLDRPDENAGLTIGPRLLLVENARLLLDGMFIKNVIIRDSHVRYKGGSMELQNVYFENCTFDVSQQTRSQEFAKAIFSSPNTSITLKLG